MTVNRVGIIIVGQDQKATRISRYSVYNDRHAETAGWLMSELWLFVAALGGGFVILIFSADRFVLGAASIARNLGVPSLIIGLTIVGFGTSAPEILVSSLAAWNGNVGLAVGNALGSNIANIGLILGCTALIAPVTVHSRALRQEMPLLLMACLAAFGVSYDHELGRLEGASLLAGLGLFLSWLVWQARKAPASDPLVHEVESELPPDISLPWAWFWFLLGLLGLVLSSKSLVWASVGLAHHFGVSDLVIGLTVVALGTSLPELAASIASMLKQEDDLVIGNIIGSNMFNILAVYAMPGLIRPSDLTAPVITRDFPWMLGMTAALLLLGLGRRNPSRISRLGGATLLSCFIVYQSLLYLSLKS